jgi:CBS domain-containing protein
MLRPAVFVSFDLRTPAAELLRHLGEATWQDTFPVLDGGRMVGLVTTAGLQTLALEQSALPSAIAADLMLPPVSVGPEDDLRRAASVLVQNDLREVPVEEEGRVVGFLDEARVAEAYARVVRPSGPGPQASTEQP